MRIALPLLVLLGLACTRTNPAYRGPVSAGDAAASDGSGDLPSDGGGDVVTDLGADVLVDAGPDNPLACAVAADCMTRNGRPPCGAWECRAGACVVICPNCTDLDHDGYGVGTGCAGADCDDADFNIRATAPARSCYSGPNGTDKMGVCRAGSQSCNNGVWTTCAGQVLPSAEACNAEDDDCDGMVDDLLPALSCGLGACANNNVPSCTGGVLGVCVPHGPAASNDPCDGIDNDCDGQIDEDCPANRDACIHVSPNGDDGGDGSTGDPFRTLSMAISAAAAAAPTGTVCVASGSDCDARTSYTLPAGFQMANGVSVYGNYQSSTWLQCPINPAAPDPHVTLALSDGPGVRFPVAVTLATALDGFVLRRADVPLGTTIGVTINGGKKVRLSNLVIDDQPLAQLSYGVNLINGGEALITHCNIVGGAGTTGNIGVRSVGSTLTLRENCAAVDATTGRCTAGCTTSPPVGISGRVDNGTVGFSTAVHLEASPGALVETSTVCASQGAVATGVRILGNATGTVVRGDLISASAGETDSIGVWAQDCGDAAPWIVGNQLIAAEGGTRVTGVRAVGSCAPVIDSNPLISANGDGSTTEADGVACQINDNGAPSLCEVIYDEIHGSANPSPARSIGLVCGEKSCSRVADNVLLGNQGQNVIGLLLRNDGVTVERNQITGGCAQTDASGIVADDSFSRVQNNLVSGGTCTSDSSIRSVGVRVYNNLDQNEMDIHSNTIDGGGNSGTSGPGNGCTSVGLEWGVGPETVPTAPKGIVRNNILLSGQCNTHMDFAEVLAGTDPRLFENNDLDPGTGNTILYFNEGTTAIREIAAVNALTDTMVRGNISADPRFASATNLHLMTGSPCVSAGTSAGAPTTDKDGKARDRNKPTIGAYE